jgi:Invasion associated locus B (IalB) protein
MIRALLARLGLAALLCSVAPLALAQQVQQRSRTEPKQAQPSQQRGTTSSTQPKPAANSTAQQKPGANSTAQQKPGAGSSPKPGAAGQGKPGGAQGPGGGQATLLATFNDWGAYATGQGRTKVCYALSQPKDRQPKDLKRDPGYLFVSFRPADNVRNEVALVMGFATRDGGPAEATVGTSTYALITKGGNAWIRNPTEESQVIAAFSKGKDVNVKATSGRGNATTDRYSLSGFAQALDRARKECS